MPVDQEVHRDPGTTASVCLVAPAYSVPSWKSHRPPRRKGVGALGGEPYLPLECDYFPYRRYGLAIASNG